jgi:hypothetical protein
VKTTSSSYHNHFKEPSRFSLINKKKRFRYPLRVSIFWKKQFPMVFSPASSHKNYEPWFSATVLTSWFSKF